MTDRHLTHDIRSDAVCPYCDKLIADGSAKRFGESLLHAECYEAFGLDLEAMDVPEYEDNPEDDQFQPTEDDIDYAYRSYYGFGFGS